MTPTTSYRIKNTKEVKDALKLLDVDELEADLLKIKDYTDISDHSLKPIDFYDGIEDFDASGSFPTFVEDFVTLIKDINEYIDAMARANSSGVFFGGAAAGSESLNYISDDINKSNNVTEYNFVTDPSKVFNPTTINADTNYGVVSPDSNNNSNNNSNSIDSGEYTIVDQIVDTNGNVVAVAIVDNGIKKWVQVSNGKIINPNDEIKTYLLSNDVEIVVDGVKTIIPSGNYDVDKVIYNSDGTRESVRIICGDYKLWLHFDANGNVSMIDYIREQNGVFSIVNANYDMVDMYGNIIGKFDKGDYFIYDVLYDSNGNPKAYRLSPDNEYEKWLYPNGNLNDGVASLFDSYQKNNSSSLSLFAENKGLFGVLGVLFVALGATLVLRKKVKKKEEALIIDSTDDYYEDDSITEENLKTGNYGIYDVKRNEEGIVTEARINPMSESDEYWVEV